MDCSGLEEPRYVEFPHLPDHATRDGKPALNKYSHALTRDHDFPGAQVRRREFVVMSAPGTLTNAEQAMLYAAGVPDRHTMETAPQVGIASVWWEGNPCK